MPQSRMIGEVSLINIAREINRESEQAKRNEHVDILIASKICCSSQSTERSKAFLTTTMTTTEDD